MNKISIFRKNKLVESTLLQGALVAFIFYIGGLYYTIGSNFNQGGITKSFTV